MQALVKSYRRGRNTQNPRQVIVYPKGVEKASQAGALLGAKVRYTTKSGKTLQGNVTAAHGNNGAVRVFFQRPLPGDALGGTVTILTAAEAHAQAKISGKTVEKKKTLSKTLKAKKVKPTKSTASKKPAKKAPVKKAGTKKAKPSK